MLFSGGSGAVDGNPISQDGDALAASTNGVKAVPLYAELHDVFFTPSLWRTRNIFQRDGSGNITGFVARTDGHDLTFTKMN